MSRSPSLSLGGIALFLVAVGCGGADPVSPASDVPSALDGTADNDVSIDASGDSSDNGASPTEVSTSADAAPDGDPEQCDRDHDGERSRSFACGGEDCDDNDQHRFHGNPELCDDSGHDEDCNPCTVAGMPHDGDGDHDDFAGYGCYNTYAGIPPTCDLNTVRIDTAMLRVTGRDCDDGNNNVRPNQTEACNTIDDNCNGFVNEDVTGTPYWPDGDDDGYGDARAMPTSVCAMPAGFVANNDDCNDGDRSVHPGASEQCDGVDQNCNGQIDEGVTASGTCATGLPSLCSAGQNYCGGSRRPDTRGFILNWLTLGPFDSPSVTTTDQLDTRDLIGGEAAAAPTPGSAVASLTWTAWNLTASATTVESCTGLGTRFASPSGTALVHSTAYAFVSVFSPSDRDAELALGCDDGCRAWLNGAQVFSRSTPSGCALDAATPRVRLRAGLNRLLLKVTNGSGGTGFAARFRWVGSGAPMRDLSVAAAPSERALQCGQTGMPVTETCNLADDDCDGTVDNTCACSLGATRSCGSAGRGLCRAGTQRCIMGAGGRSEWGACDDVRPSPELCSTADEDCDGNSYNGFPVPGSHVPCNCGGGLTLFGGSAEITAACTPGVCVRPSLSTDPVAGRVLVSNAFFFHDTSRGMGSFCDAGWCFTCRPPTSVAINVISGTAVSSSGLRILTLPPGRYRFVITARATSVLIPISLRLQLVDASGREMGHADGSLGFGGSVNIAVDNVLLATDCTPFDVVVSLLPNASYPAINASFSLSGLTIERT